MKAISIQLEDLKDEGKEIPKELINDLKEFEQLVYRVRIEQRGFFNSNRPETRKRYLMRAKEFEERLDIKLAQMGYSKQQELF